MKIIKPVLKALDSVGGWMNEHRYKTAAGILLAFALSAGTDYHLLKRQEIVRKGNVTAPRYFNPNDSGISAANRAVMDFPNEIPGAASIDKYITPGAEYCIVHVRQMHLTKDISDKEKKEVLAMQKDMYRILSYLVENNGLKEVHQEAISEEFEDMANASADISDLLDKSWISGEEILQTQIDRLEFRLGSDIGLSMEAEEKFPGDDEACIGYVAETKAKLEEEVARLKARFPRTRAIDAVYLRIKEEQDSYNAVHKLASEGRIKIVAAEYTLANLKAGNVVEDAEKNGNMVTRKDMSSIIDDREDIALDILAKQEKPLAVFVYGGAHAWGGWKSCGAGYSLKGKSSFKDNIAVWNKENPGKKFSLIELTPESYEEFMRE